MFKYLLIISITLMLFIVFQLYKINYNINDVQNSIELLHNKINYEKNRINILYYKLSVAKSPKNITKLNDILLNLQLQKIEQFITINELPYKVFK